jgi:hypothetical protein
MLRSKIHQLKQIQQVNYFEVELVNFLHPLNKVAPE